MSFISFFKNNQMQFLYVKVLENWAWWCQFDDKNNRMQVRKNANTYLALLYEQEKTLKDLSDVTSWVLRKFYRTGIFNKGEICMLLQGWTKLRDVVKFCYLIQGKKYLLVTLHLHLYFIHWKSNFSKWGHAYLADSTHQKPHVYLSFSIFAD